MHWSWIWAGIFVGVGLADFGVRLGTEFDMVWVVRAEAVLFPATGIVLWLLHRRRPVQTPWQRHVQLSIVAFLFLGGLRSALWASGLVVERANTVVLAVGLPLLVEILRRRHRARATD